MKKLTTTSTTTLSEVHAFNRENWEDGCICAGCGQLVKKWNKPLVGTAVADLIRLYALYDRESVAIHISRFTKQRSNFYTLVYWGLIEKGEIEVDKKKRSSGYWVPTKKGRYFVEGQISIPAKAETYNNKVVAFCGDEVYVRQALGKQFDYEELING